MKHIFEAGRALLIGIGQGYPGKLELPAVVRADAEGVARVLTDPALCGYPRENVQLLLDEQATRANIVEGLHRLANTAQPADTVFLFFSGHGGQRPFGDDAGTYLCPVDFDSDDPRATGIEANELSTFISTIPAARVVVVLDACHSEGAVFLKGTDDEKRLNFGFRSPALEKLAAGAGRVAVSSCKDEETSITYVEKGHSLFTYFLLEGLRGAAMDRGDGVIRVLDIFHYVSDEVPRNARGGHKQHPVLKAHAESNFPLALRKGGWLKNTNDASPSSVKQSVDVRKLEEVLSQLYPSGPGHNEVWSRAGGDQSTLTLSGNGRASWHAAIRMLSQGGGGQEISLGLLIKTALSDYPNNTNLRSLTSPDDALLAIKASNESIALVESESGHRPVATGEGDSDAGEWNALLGQEAAVRRKWLKEGLLVTADELGAVWSYSRQALYRAERRGDLFSLAVGKHRYFPAVFMMLELKAVKAVCLRLRGKDAVSKFVFWQKAHGELSGLTPADAIQAGQGEKVARLAESWSAERS